MTVTESSDRLLDRVRADKPRIAVFMPDLTGGGAERSMLNLAIGLAEAGCSVDMVLAVVRGPYVKQIPSTVNLVDLKTKDVALSLPALVDYLKRARPVGMVSALNQPNVLAVIARKLAGVDTRLVSSTQNHLSVESKNGKSLKLKVMPYFVRTFFPGADVVSGNSHGVAADLAKLIGMPRERVPVLFNPVVTKDLFDKASGPVDHPWLVDDSVPVLITVGRLHHQKNHELLLEAFARVRKTRPVRLIILGEGGLRGDLEEQAKRLNITDDLDMPGFVDNPYAYLSRSFAFVLSSRFEGLPTVLIEAMACGTPVVSTDCPSGPYEITQNRKYGILVPVADVDALTDGLQRVLDNGRQRPPREAWEPYTTEAVVRGYLEALLPQGTPAQ